MKHIKTHLIFLFVTSCFLLQGQSTFEKFYSDTIFSEWGSRSKMLLLPDSGYAYTQFSNNYHLIGRTDKTGTPVWTKALVDTQGYLLTTRLALSPSGKLYATANYIDTSGFMGLATIMSLDLSGNLLWSKAYGRANYKQEGMDIYATSNALYLFGRIEDSLYYTSIFMQKSDTGGNVIFNKTFNCLQLDEFNASTQLANGNFLVTGKTYSNTSSGSLMLCTFEVDGSGSIIANNMFSIPGLSDMQVHSMSEDASGNIVLTGWIYFTGSTNLWDIFMIKLDKYLNYKWGKYYGGTDYDEGWSVFANKRGGYDIVAEPESFGGVSRIAIIRTDSLGSVLWTKLYGHPAGGFPNGAVMNKDYGYTMYGPDGDYGINSPMFLIRTDSLGFLGCYETVSTPSGSFAATATASISSATFSGLLPFNINAVPHPVTTKPYCVPTAIAAIGAQGSSTMVYPNPFCEELNITDLQTGYDDRVAIQLIEPATGRVVMQRETATGSVTLSTGDIACGLYLLSIRQKNEAPLVVKVMKAE